MINVRLNLCTLITIMSQKYLNLDDINLEIQGFFSQTRILMIINIEGL